LLPRRVGHQIPPDEEAAVADEDEIEEIEAERKRRLAPENRPDNAEVDNTGG
jgi:hypothetical protein